MRDDWRAADRWLSTRKAVAGTGERIATQPWYALADVYDRNGDPAGARRLRLSAAKLATRQAPWPTRCLRWAYFVTAGNGYRPWLAALWLMGILAASMGLVAVNRDDITPTDRAAAISAVHNHFGVTDKVPEPERGVRLRQADQFLPVTAETPCEVHPDYPCMQSLTFALNAVLPPAASTNRDWDVAPDATLVLAAGLPLLKLAAWAFAALLLAGITGLLRKN